MVEIKNYKGVDSKGNNLNVTIVSGPVIIKGGKVLLDKHGDDKF